MLSEGFLCTLEVVLFAGLSLWTCLLHCLLGFIHCRQREGLWGGQWKGLRQIKNDETRECEILKERQETTRGGGHDDVMQIGE